MTIIRQFIYTPNTRAVAVLARLLQLTADRAVLAKFGMSFIRYGNKPDQIAPLVAVFWQDGNVWYVEGNSVEEIDQKDAERTAAEAIERAVADPDVLFSLDAVLVIHPVTDKGREWLARNVGVTDSYPCSDEEGKERLYNIITDGLRVAPKA